MERADAEAPALYSQNKNNKDYFAAGVAGAASVFVASAFGAAFLVVFFFAFLVVFFSVVFFSVVVFSDAAGAVVVVA